jgi:hypothetical protein
MQRYISLRDPSLRTVTRLMAYYAQRIMVSRRLRRASARLIQYALRYKYPSGQLGCVCSGLTQAFQKDGYVSLGQVLTRTECDDIHEYLSDKRLLDNRGSGAEFNFLNRPDGVKLGDYTLETVVHCPHIMELANRAELVNLATEYLGFTPTVTNLSLRWSFPTDRPAGEVQTFHRDSEVGCFKILVYLTEVDMMSGPHVYVDRSHHNRMPLRLRLYSDEEIERSYEIQTTFTGPVGTAFAIDTKGIHKGVPPINRPRLILGIQYSLLPCLLYEYAPVQFKTASSFDAYINRLIVRCSDPEAQRSGIDAEDEQSLAVVP